MLKTERLLRSLDFSQLCEIDFNICSFKSTCVYGCACAVIFGVLVRVDVM